GYLGGLKKETFMSLMQKSPETVIKHAVKGMLPHNRLGRQLLKKLKVYRGSQHPHQAQTPVILEMK
ncbi:MAG: uL13 family ribosomal protein, partial [Candidatus Ratteibacteria bacterium]